MPRTSGAVCREQTTCPYCRGVLGGDTIRLWGVRDYHRRCVEKAVPALLDDVPTEAPQEVLRREHVRLWPFLRYAFPRYLIWVFALFSIPLVGSVADKPAQEVWLTVLSVAMMLGIFCIGYSLLQGMVGVLMLRRSLPKTVQFLRDEVIIATLKRSRRYRLNDCRFRLGRTTWDDPVALFTKQPPGLLLITPDDRVACGYSADMLERFRNYLTLERVRTIGPTPYVSLTLGTLLSGSLGAVLGFALGRALAQWADNKFLPGVLAILGFVDGGTAALLFLTASLDAPQAAWKRLNPWLMAVAYFAMGLLLGAFVGPRCALWLACLNALFAFLLGWLCRRRIRQAEELAEREHRSCP